MRTLPPPARPAAPPVRPPRARSGLAWGGAALLGLAVGVLYLRTLAPGLGGTIDSAEFQHATYGLSIVHPTGYPLYLLLGRLWITLLPVGDVAYRVNLLSAACAVGAVLGIYATVLHLTRAPWAGWLAGLAAATHGLIWEQAVVAEVNSLNLLLVIATLYALLRWRTGEWPLWPAGLLYGLALTNHRTALLVASGILLFLVLVGRRERAVSRRAALGGLLAVLLPLALYLYIPLRAATTPWYTNTWDNFWSEVGGASAIPAIQETLGRPLGPRLLVVADVLFPGLRDLLTPRLGALRDAWPELLLGGLAGIGGLAALASRRGKEPTPGFRADGAVMGLYALPALLIAGVMVIYDVDVIGDYLALVVALLAVGAGVGAAAVIRVLHSRLRPPSLGRLAAVGAALLLLAVPLAQLGRNFAANDWHDRNEARRFWQAVQAAPPLAPNAFVIGGWNRYNELRYLQQVEGWRPDLRPQVLDDLVGGNHLGYLDEWLAQGQAIYLVDPVPDITDHFAGQPEAGLLRLTARAEVTQPAMEHAVNVRFGNDIVLEGYTVRPAQPRAGNTLRITLFWRALARPSDRLVVFTHLISRDRIDEKVGQKDDEPGRGYRPTTGWTPDQRIVDTLDLPISPATPPATYRLMVGLYTRFGEKRLTATNAAGRPLGNYWEMTTVAVSP